MNVALDSSLSLGEAKGEEVAMFLGAVVEIWIDSRLVNKVAAKVGAWGEEIVERN